LVEGGGGRATKEGKEYLKVWGKGGGGKGGWRGVHSDGRGKEGPPHAFRWDGAGEHFLEKVCEEGLPAPRPLPSCMFAVASRLTLTFVCLCRSHRARIHSPASRDRHGAAGCDLSCASSRTHVPPPCIHGVVGPFPPYTTCILSLVGSLLPTPLYKQGLRLNPLSPPHRRGAAGPFSEPPPVYFGW
jgi:hypothetical protein